MTHHLKLTLTGTVQGVGLRPALAAFARKRKMTGDVCNTGCGVVARFRWPMENRAMDVPSFVAELLGALPRSAEVATWQGDLCEDVVGLPVDSFEIKPSTHDHLQGDWPRDFVTCEKCLEEFQDPQNRRHFFPFVSCTQCGPKYTVTHSLPFDRNRTTMASFELCSGCQTEYNDEADRRYHAQTLSCFDCGPTLSFALKDGAFRSARGPDEVRQILGVVAKVLNNDGLLLMKGLGGYQLLADARSTIATLRLRQLKARPAKPFAVMVADIHAARSLCYVSEKEVDALRSPHGPIVICAQKKGIEGQCLSGSSLLSFEVTCGLGTLGVLLPPTALHMALSRQINAPLIVTSANSPGQPMVTEDELALRNFRDQVDAVLNHNRPILRRADDSLVRQMGDDITTFRCGRGLAPQALQTRSQHALGLGAGSSLKNSVAVLHRGKITTSPHVGSLTSVEAEKAHEEMKAEMSKVFGSQNYPSFGDRHPQFLEKQTAEGSETLLPHHMCHALACAIENDFKGKALVAVWDGFGLGEHNQHWGGEFFSLETGKPRLHRLASIRPFELIGGERAHREPWRCALALLKQESPDDYWSAWESLQHDNPKCFSAKDKRLLDAKFNGSRTLFAQTTSIGRLFDGCSSLLGLTQQTSFEGEAAMHLEDICLKDFKFQPFDYVWERHKSGGATEFTLNWLPTIHHMLAELRGKRHTGRTVPVLATRSHQTLVAALLECAHSSGFGTLLLSGGVFQNRYLVETLLRQAERQHTRVLQHRKVPPGDGGLAVGQLAYTVYGFKTPSAQRSRSFQQAPRHPEVS